MSEVVRQSQVEPNRTTDRLRAAADRLALRASVFTDFAEDDDDRREVQEIAAIAALLRAVADVHQPLRFKHDVIACSSDDHLWPCATAAAALDLAKVILGDTSE